MNNFIISKFGGSSMMDAKAMNNSAIVALKQSSKIIFVSATHGTTNQLIELSQLSIKKSWVQSEKIINKIFKKHHQIAKDLNIKEIHNLKELLEEIKTLSRGIFLLKDCSSKAYDALLSLGERLSSLLFTQAMVNQSNEVNNIEHFDIRKVIRTNDQFKKAIPDLRAIRTLSKKYFLSPKHHNKIFVTQGFIGCTKDKQTTTLGRGGSDYSAALIAEAVHAKVLQIWTDVPGMATTDPKITSAAKIIEEITFSEAAQLATFGAKILHPATIMPAWRKKIPVYIGSSYEPKKKGTWIKPSCLKSSLITAIALKKQQTLLTLTNPRMLNTHGFLNNVFQVFSQYQVSVDSITTSEISIALTVDESVLLEKKLIKELKKITTVEIEKDLGLISLIGNEILKTSGLAKEIFFAIKDINVRMICLGASKHNFCFLVKDSQAKDAIIKLHKKFIGD